MGLSGGNFANPLDFTNSNDNTNVLPNPLEALPNFGVDLRNPLDSGIASQLSSPPGGGDSSRGGSKGGVMDLFGSLSLDGLPDPIETTRSLINAPLNAAESIAGVDPGGVFKLGRDINNAPSDLMQSFGTPTLDFGSSDKSAQGGSPLDGPAKRSENTRYNPNELSLTLSERLTESPEGYSALAVFAMQFLKAMKLQMGDRLMPETNGDAPLDPKIAEQIRARRSAAPARMVRTAYPPGRVPPPSKAPEY